MMRPENQKKRDGGYTHKFFILLIMPKSSKSNKKISHNGQGLRRMDMSLESSQPYLALRKEMEKQLLAIWTEVLMLNPEKIDVNDNFFELGGHSLLNADLANVEFEETSL